MRTVPSSVIAAIETPSTYSMRVNIAIQKNRLFFDSIDNNDSIPDATAAGWFDAVVPQDIAYPTSGSGLVTFYNIGGQLKYSTQGNSSLVDSNSGTIVGKPGVYGNYLYKISSNGNLYRYNIDYSAMLSHSATVLSSETLVGTPTSGSGAVHAISDTEVACLIADDGGIRPVVYTLSGSWSEHKYSGRFMFPSREDSANVKSLTVPQMTVFSGAAKLGNRIFLYQSNLLTGTVDCIYYDTVAIDWSDIYTAVPTDLSVSLCQFRVSKCYTHDGNIYMSGQFRRTEAGEVIQPYSMILCSTDGKIFSINRMSLVSTLGYRFQALVNSDYLYLATDNRVSRKPVTHYFSPSSGSSGYTHINEHTVNLTENNGETLSIKPAAGDNTLLDSGYLENGNRLILDVGYLTSGSLAEYTQYGIYIIDTIQTTFRNGEQSVEINCVNESTWHLSSMISPFYTEMISKSSLFTDFSTEGYWTDAANGGTYENEFSIDFWNADTYSSGSITGATIAREAGGLSEFRSDYNHCFGISTGDIIASLGSNDYPICTASSVTAKVYGWSYNLDDGQSDNDLVRCRLIMESSGSAHEEYYVESTKKRFPNTYPVSSGSIGDYPIVYTLSTIIGDKIKSIALIYESESKTAFYPHRVDITAGVSIGFSYNSGTSWEYTSGSGVEIPGFMRPYIMTAVRPYNAWNFQLAASFTNSITSGSFQYNSWVGLTGHVHDSNNYTVARYDKTSGNCQIAKVREKQETILTSGSGYSSGSSGEIELMFSHRDGLFKLYTRFGTGWIEQLSYEWKASDGYMLYDNLSSTNSGIYGFIDPPYFRTSGFELSSNGTYVDAVGIPVLPGFGSFNDFPSTGIVEVDGIRYSYSGKLTCDPIRGPSQFRNNARWSPPFGNGAALEATDHDWSKAAGYLTGKFAALDDGYVFPITNTLWQPWITTDGAVVNLPGRSRFYSNDIVSLSAHSLSNRVYITGGLTGVAVVKGDIGYHSWGSDVRYMADGHLYCNWFYGSSGDYDSTVRDLVDHVSKISGAKAQFLGDKTYASETINGTFTSGSLQHCNGLDAYFTANLSSGQYIELESDNTIFVGDNKSAVRITCVSGDTYTASLISRPSNTVVNSFEYTLAGSGRYRILYHESFATVYVNDRWLFTYCPASIEYPITMQINLKTSTSIVVTDIVLTELCDWREAIYIDFETDSKSAVGSIIQERPVEIYAQPDGSVSYWYIPTRSQIDQIADHIASHGYTDTIPKNSSSDAIVYYENVGTINNSTYASQYGFTTRVYRMPNLSNGALRAAKIIQQRELEGAKMHSLTIRPDIRIQLGDILHVVYTAAGSGRSQSFDIVVTEIGMSISGEGARHSMSIQGRSI